VSSKQVDPQKRASSWPAVRGCSCAEEGGGLSRRGGGGLARLARIGIQKRRTEEPIGAPAPRVFFAQTEIRRVIGGRG